MFLIKAISMKEMKFGPDDHRFFADQPSPHFLQMENSSAVNLGDWGGDRNPQKIWSKTILFIAISFKEIESI